MGEKHERMPRAEGYVGLRRVGPDEDAVVMGGESKKEKAKQSVDTKPQHYSADGVINEGADKNELPTITEKEFKNLHSRDGGVSLVAEKLLKQKMVERGLNPEQEGVARIMVGDRELRVGIGSDFGTLLVEKGKD